MNRLVAITGGIGVGKSAVSGRLASLGATVYDADAASRAVVEPGGEGLKGLVARFGDGILKADGTLARKTLAGRIFSSEEDRLAVNAILHPLMQRFQDERIAAFCAANPDTPLFLEIPLLIEAGMQDGMDEVWLVTADEQTRIARIILRDGCTRGEAIARIESQMPQAEKERYADRIIDNSGDMDALFQTVDGVYRAFMEQYGYKTGESGAR